MFVPMQSVQPFYTSHQLPGIYVVRNLPCDAQSIREGPDHIVLIFPGMDFQRKPRASPGGYVHRLYSVPAGCT